MERIDRQTEIRDKLPDHLTLPQYSDRFVAKNDAKFVTEMSRDYHKGKNSLNDLKFLTGLRFGNDKRFREQKFEKEKDQQKAEENYLKERNWDLGLLTKKKEDESKFEGKLRRYDSNFEPKLLSVMKKKNSVVLEL